MAEVKMELSEYKRLEKVEEDLRESLKTQKEYAEQIDQLRKEKIEALEDAKMKVVYVHKTEKREFVVTKQDPYHVMDVLYNLIHMMKERGGPNSLVQRELRYFMDKAFETREVTSMDIKPTVTTKGLDEVKVELKEKITKELKGKVEDAEKVLKEKADLILANEELKKEVAQTMALKLDMEQEFIASQKKLKFYRERIDKAMEVLKKVGWTNYNYKTLEAKRLLCDIEKIYEVQLIKEQ